MKRIWGILIFVFLASCNEQTFDEFLDTAKKQLADNNKPAAVITLKNAIRISPSSAEARFLLGKIYWQQQQYDSAEKELNKALMLKYPAQEVIPLLAKTYHKTYSDFDLLALELNQTGMSSEQKVEVAFYKLQAHLRLNQVEEAKKITAQIKLYDTSSPFKALAESYVFFVDEKPTRALGQINKLLKETPKQADALKLKAMLLLKQNKTAQAVQVYQEYTDVYPEDIESTFILARLLTSLDRTKEAEPIVDSLMKTYDNHMLLNQLKGIARFKAKDNENALLYTKKAILQRPNDPALRLVAAYSAYQMRDCETAYRQLSFIADKIPPAHPALRLLSICQVNLGLGIEASETLTSINKVSAQDVGLFSMVGLALINQGETLRAKEILSASPREGNVEDLTRLGILQLSLNDVSAILTLEHAYKLDPNKELSKTTLATAYLHAKQEDNALALAKSLKQEDSKDGQAYLIAGLAYINKQNYESAKEEFQHLVILEPNNAKAELLLIDVLNNLGEQAKAKIKLNDLLEKHPLYIPALVKLYLFTTNKAESANVIAHIKSKVRSSPKNINLILALAKIQVAEGLYKNTVEMLTSISEHENKSDTYWDILGQAYLQLNQFRQAKNHYRDWLIEKPSNTFAIVGNLLLMDLFREFEQALLLTSKYLAMHGRDNQFELLHTYFLIKVEDFSAANQSFYRLPQAVRDLPFSKGLVGQLQMNKNNFIDALPNLLVAYNHLPNTQNVQLIYSCYYGLGQGNKSYSFLKTHVENYPDDLESLMQLAALQIDKNLDDAMENYEQALKIAPENFIALNNLASFYLQKNLLEQAEINAEKALELQPNQAFVLDTYGQILLAKKEYQRALTYFSKAVSDKSVIDDIYLNYIEALLLTEQFVLAQRKIKQRKFTLSHSIEKLASLKEKYKI